MKKLTPDDVADFRRANGQTWTNDTPSQSGFYWLCSDEEDPEIAKVIRGSDRTFVYPAGHESFEIENSSIYDDIA